MTLLSKYVEERIEKGIEERLEERLEERVEERLEESVINLHAEGISTETIAKSLNLNLDFVKQTLSK